MIPLLFLNPGWIKKNPVVAVLIGVIFISLSLAWVDWWRGQDKIRHTVDKEKIQMIYRSIISKTDSALR